MTKPDVFTLASIPGLLNLRSLYFLAYSWLFGMSVWISFFGGFIAYKTLPRQQFGNLQHKTFPVYFFISIVLSSGLFVYWTFSHPNVIAHIGNPGVADVTQAYALAFVFVSQGLNYWVIGPLTSKVMFQRHKLEKDEGKTYSDPGVSKKMKSLNRRFGMLHGISSLGNLGAVIALIFHGLWIGDAGLVAK